MTACSTLFLSGMHCWRGAGVAYANAMQVWRARSEITTVLSRHGSPYLPKRRLAGSLCPLLALCCLPLFKRFCEEHSSPVAHLVLSFFCQPHLSRKKSPNCLQLIATCKSSFKWDMASHHSLKFKSAWQLLGFFVEGRRTKSLICREKTHRVAYNWRPGCSLYHLIQTEHDQSTLKTFQEFKARNIFVEAWTSLIKT